MIKRYKNQYQAVLSFEIITIMASEATRIKAKDIICATGIPEIFSTLSILKCSTKILAIEYKIKYIHASTPGRFETFLNKSKRITSTTINRIS